MGSIAAFGNPLLDTIVRIPRADILARHNLKSDDQKEITEDEMQELFKDTQNFERTLRAGGCAQNTLRVMQWFFRKKCQTTFFGSVGNDSNGEILQKLMRKDGVDVRYFKQKNHQTGVSLALIYKEERTLLAHLGAAEVLTLDDLLKTNVAKELMDADIIYLEGFFLTKRKEAAEFVLEFCKKHRKKLAFNICGQYMCRMYPNEVKNFASNCDILFGNKREFEGLKSITGVSSLVDLQYDSDKILVMTDGGNCVKCVHSDKVIEEFSVPEIDKREIVDTTGAGDAFVAGYLTGYLLKRTPTNCVELGCYAAQEIIKGAGCTIPRHSPNILI